MVGPRFIPESILYTQSVMLSLLFIPETMFYTQSVVRSQSAVHILYWPGSSAMFNTWEERDLRNKRSRCFLNRMPMLTLKVYLVS